MPQRPLGVGVIGLGFMGTTHLKAYQAAAAAGGRCRLVAVADPDSAKLSGRFDTAGNLSATSSAEQLFDPAQVFATQSAEALLARPDVDAVSICTYTDTHVDLATRALAAGKHVLLEKPVALTVADVMKVHAAAVAAGRLCVPAMCMRFWPGWGLLRDHLRKADLGRALSLAFTRMGSGPTWAHQFYGDELRSGGALFDLHVHDVDFIYWCLGMPTKVYSSGTTRHMTTAYSFQSGPSHVTAQAAWSLAPAAGFRMHYLAAFADATIEFDLAKPQPLAIHHHARTDHPKVPPGTGYEPQVEHFVSCILDDRPPCASLRDAAAVTSILEAERRSLASGMPEVPHPVPA